MAKHGYDPLKDDDMMPFGKHSDKQMIDVPASYLLYLWDDGQMAYGNVRDYIEENLELLKQKTE